MWASNSMCYRNCCFVLEDTILSIMDTIFVALMQNSCVFHGKIHGMSTSHNMEPFIYYGLYVQKMRHLDIGQLVDKLAGT